MPAHHRRDGPDFLSVTLSPVKVIAVSVMRNEADVVEMFVRHHAEFVDELIVVDHMSCDPP